MMNLNYPEPQSHSHQNSKIMDSNFLKPLEAGFIK